MFHFLKNKNISGDVKVFNNTALNLHESSSIIVENGIFEINRKWTTNDNFPFVFSMGEYAKIIVQNSFSVFSGSRIYINSGAELILGGGYINNNLNLSCFKKIEIGHSTVISENVCIRDSDNHQILNSGHIMTQPVKIGNHVWIGMNVTILKGVTIGDGAVIAAGTVVHRNVPAKSMVAGIPCRIVKSDVDWM